MIDTSLVRHTDTCWSYYPPKLSARSASQPLSSPSKKSDLDEIRIEVPSSLQGNDRYTMVQLITEKIFKANRINFETLRKGFSFRTEREEHWKLVAANVNQSFLRSCIQKIPCFAVISHPRVMRMTLSRVHNSPCCQKISKITSFYLNPRELLLPVFNRPFHAEISFPELLRRPQFSDPFTELAALSFQSAEQFFVMESAHRGSLQFVRRGGRLRLDPIEDTASMPRPSPRSSPPSPSHTAATEGSQETSESIPVPLSPRMTGNFLDAFLDTTETGTSSKLSQQKEENRTILSYFMKHLRQEYGVWLIDFLKHTYDLDLKKMYEEGLPLFPDHVFKANIGANNIEYGHLVALVHTLRRLVQDIEQSPLEHKKPFLDYLVLRDEIGSLGHLSLRECRKLIQQVQEFSHKEAILLEDVLVYLKGLLPEETREPASLPPAQFHALVHLLVSTTEELDRAFTGRKIRHSAIFGYHTMGDKKVANSCRDLFELLHIFQEMKESSWPAYFELLSHVVAKKTLFRRNIDGTGWHVGLLLPGPNVNEGHETWYYNDTFLDDSKGNFSYTLKPACDGYRQGPHEQLGPKPLPYIKLYRSTASDKSALNSHDSLRADLNPDGSPGSLNPSLSYEYERKNFESRTLPLWMGYVLLGYLYKDKPTPSYEGWMQKAVQLFAEYRTQYKKESVITEGELTALQKMRSERNYPLLLETLLEKSTQLGEDPRMKISQDIAFVGHSLGGGLAQDGVYQFCTRTKRVPLPEATIICSTSHPPAIDNVKNTRFMNLGQEHQEMLSLNRMGYHIWHQFELGDFVPQAGGSHLGTPVYPPKPVDYHELSLPSERQRQWLTFHAHVFKPLISAKSMEIVDVPTHGRRIGHAMLDRDYSLQELTSQQVGEFDHALILKGDVRKAFGYRILNSPKLSEWVRKKIGRLAKWGFASLEWFHGFGMGDRDENGVWYMRFSQKRALQQLFSPTL